MEVGGFALGPHKWCHPRRYARGCPRPDTGGWHPREVHPSYRLFKSEGRFTGLFVSLHDADTRRREVSIPQRRDTLKRKLTTLLDLRLTSVHDPPSPLALASVHLPPSPSVLLRLSSFSTNEYPSHLSQNHPAILAPATRRTRVTFTCLIKGGRRFLPVSRRR